MKSHHPTTTLQKIINFHPIPTLQKIITIHQTTSTNLSTKRMKIIIIQIIIIIRPTNRIITNGFFRNTNALYQVILLNAHSINIRRQGNFKHVKSYTRQRVCNYILCHQCHEYLVQNNNNPKYIWPSFYCKIISGYHKSTFNGNYNFMTFMICVFYEN